MKRKKKTAKITAQRTWKVTGLLTCFTCWFHFIYIASLIFNWNPEAVWSGTVKHSVEQDSLQAWGEAMCYFVDMSSLVRYKVLTDASGEVASSFAKCNWHYSQHKETYNRVWKGGSWSCIPAPFSRESRIPHVFHQFPESRFSFREKYIKKSNFYKS